METPSESYGTSLAIWDHTGNHLPPDTSERAPPITPTMEAGTRFTYPGGMEG